MVPLKNVSRKYLECFLPNVKPCPDDSIVHREPFQFNQFPRVSDRSEDGLAKFQEVYNQFEFAKNN